MVTYSQRLFEEFCVRCGLVADPVKRQRWRTPDYEVQLAGRAVIFEIKQINPNRPVGDYVRNRVRPILKHVSRQLSSAARKGNSAVLVVYNNSAFSVSTAPDSILQAMFGRKNVLVTWDADGSRRVSEPFLAGNEGLTPQHNTAISAVAVLQRSSNGTLSLDVYHNPFAKIRLEPDCLAGLPVRQVVVETGHLCAYGSWPELQRYGVVER